MKVSLISPIYNEESHLKDFLEKIDSLQLPIEKELIFVDDCSKDSSFEVLNTFTIKSNVKIFQQEKYHENGAALMKGIEETTGEIIGIQDADFEYDMDYT
jgi:glycosyltransferase involved in cell wall biosynthesis